MDHGLDLSHYNAVSDANAVRGAGYTYAWCKATQGSGAVDASFAGKAAQLRAAGIVVGAYHYMDGSDPAAQGRHFRQVAGDAGCLTTGSLLPMADMEDPAVRASADTALAAFYDTLGVEMMDCYGNLDWWSTALHANRWGARHVVGHIARYNGNPGSPGYSNAILGMQQYSDTGHVAGIPGAVDLNATLGGWSLQRLRLGGPAVPLPSPPVGGGVFAPASGNTWTVETGDTLSKIASAWGVTVAAVAAANGIPDPSKIYVKQVIRRPGTSGAAPLPPVAGSYTVRAGDTLSKIAVVAKTTVAVLVALNHIANPDRIQVGQVVVLPKQGSPAPGVVTPGVWNVRAGDTLSSIAAALHYPGGWPALAERNHISAPYLIRVDQTLHY